MWPAEQLRAIEVREPLASTLHRRGVCQHFRWFSGSSNASDPKLTFEWERTDAHDEYIWAALGHRSASSYHGFSDDPLSGFRALHADLELHGRVFVAGSDKDFLERVQRFQDLRKNAPRLP